MRILIIGYGSIGSRHGRILRQSGHSVAFLRSGHGTLPVSEHLNTNIFTDLSSALDTWQPDYIVDCTPSALHHPNLLSLQSYSIPVLVEKPFLTSPDQLDLQSKSSIYDLTHSAKIGIVFQYRFNEIINKAKEFTQALRSQEALTGYCIWSEYMPAWHPWEDYRHSYVSRSDLGGGCLLSMCHPFDYLQYIIGPIADLKIADLSSDELDVDVDNYLRCTIEFEDGSVIVLVLSMNSKHTRHTLRLDWSQCSFHADLLRSCAQITNKQLIQDIQLEDQTKDLLLSRLHSEFQDYLHDDTPFRSTLHSHLPLACLLAEAADRIRKKA